jgi:hypothetical protein
LVARGYGEPRVDFLLEWRAQAPNIVTNPPYHLVGYKAPFVRHALELATGKVALLLRLGCIAGAGRQKIYKRWPIARIWVFSARIEMRRDGWDGSTKGMLDLAWFVWDPSHTGRTEIGWLDGGGR